MNLVSRRHLALPSRSALQLWITTASGSCAWRLLLDVHAWLQQHGGEIIDLDQRARPDAIELRLLIDPCYEEPDRFRHLEAWLDDHFQCECRSLVAEHGAITRCQWVNYPENSAWEIATALIAALSDGRSPETLWREITTWFDARRVHESNPVEATAWTFLSVRQAPSSIRAIVACKRSEQSQQEFLSDLAHRLGISGGGSEAQRETGV